MAYREYKTGWILDVSDNPERYATDSTLAKTEKGPKYLNPNFWCFHNAT